MRRSSSNREAGRSIALGNEASPFYLQQQQLGMVMLLPVRNKRVWVVLQLQPLLLCRACLQPEVVQGCMGCGPDN